MNPRVIALCALGMITVPPQAAARGQDNAQAAAPGGAIRLRGIYRAAAANVAASTNELVIGDPAKNSPGFVFLVFFPDGRVKKGLIQSGIDDVISESKMRLDIASGGKYSAQWGAYQIVGGRGVIQFASGVGGQQLVSGLRGPVWNLVWRADTIVANGVPYIRLDGGGNGNLRLEGIFKPAGDTSQPGIKFTSDGQFVDQGILDNGTATGVAMGYMVYAFTSPKAGRGTYVISHYGLHLSYTNGKNPDPIFYLEPGTPRGAIQTIYINNFKYQRVS
jgi:hypothetical protein